MGSLEAKARESGLMERGEVESLGKMGWGHVLGFGGWVGQDGVTYLGEGMPRFTPEKSYVVDGRGALQSSRFCKITLLRKAVFKMLP